MDTFNRNLYIILKTTGLFYLVSILSVWILSYYSPSGPCVPGLGVLAFMLLIPVILALFLKNLFAMVKGGRINRAKTVIHGLALLSIVLMFYL